MNEESTNTEAKKPGTPSESVLRQKVVPYADEIIQKLLEHMRSKNPNVSLGAANTLLKKIIPDLKAMELTREMGTDGKRRAIELFVNLGGGFVPSNITIPASSAGSTTTTSSAIQGDGLASESQEDIHSDNGDNETSSR